MKNSILIVLIASTSLFACKSQSGAMGSDKIVSGDSDKSKVENTGDVYDMIISFISKGAGTDRVLKPKIDMLISDFNLENKTNIEPEKIGWGREGEVDYCFQFKNLSTAQKKDFMTQVKAAIGSSDMAFIALNKKSVHKR